MNKVTIQISIYKDDDLYFYHNHSFTNFDFNEYNSRQLLLDFLRKLDSLINPNHSFFSVFEVVASTAFIDEDASFTFKDFKNHIYLLHISVV